METGKSKPARKQKTPKSSATSIYSAVLWLNCFCITLIITFLQPEASQAHGFAGKRFFPSTFAVEDPFVSDEFSLLYGFIKAPAEGEEPATDESGFDMEYAKRITPKFGLSIGVEYVHLDFDGAGSESGFNNVELGAKYQFFTSEEHETLLSIGVAAEIGDTGSSDIGAEPFSVISPALYFGKGFGDLPESVMYLRPLAVTGVFGFNLPTESDINTKNDEGEKEVENIPDTLSWGFTIQYDLRYLQSFVKDVGLGAPFNRMSLIVEFPMETCLQYECEGNTTGYVNPGIVWNGKKIELGLAARIPVNSRTGDDTGIYALMHFFIDDLFPKSLGRPLFP